MLEAEAQKILGSNVGVTINGLVRKVEVTKLEPLFTKIREADRIFRKRAAVLVTGWQVKRHYSKKELEAAEAFRLFIADVLTIYGEDYGTTYDESAACTYCGVGAVQVSDLILDPGCVPAPKDVAIARVPTRTDPRWLAVTLLGTIVDRN